MNVRGKVILWKSESVEKCNYHSVSIRLLCRHILTEFKKGGVSIFDAGYFLMFIHELLENGSSDLDGLYWNLLRSNP